MIRKRSIRPSYTTSRDTAAVPDISSLHSFFAAVNLTSRNVSFFFSLSSLLALHKMIGLLIPPSGPLIPPHLQPETLSSSQLKYTISIPSTTSTLAIFLLPGQQPPPGTLAAVYIQLPPQPSTTSTSTQTQTQAQEFKLLGALGGGKHSAVFRIKGLISPSASNDGIGNGNVADMDMDSSSSLPSSEMLTLVLGLSLEPVDAVTAQLESLKSKSTEMSTQQSTALVLSRPQTQNNGSVQTKTLAKRIVTNAFNFLQSFSSDGPGGGSIPIKAFEDWWRKFERRVDNDPAFLERDL